MALNRQLCVPALGHWGGLGLGIRNFSSYSSAMPTPHPSLGLSFPMHTKWGSSSQPEWKQSWGLGRPHPTPHVDSWAQGHLAAVLARARWAGHTPLLTQQPACGRGQAEEVGFGKPSLNQSRTKASAGRLPSPGGQRAWREDESPGIVRQLCPGPGCG